MKAASFLAKCLLCLGVVAAARGQSADESLASSKAALDRRIRLNPADADAYQERGCINFKLGEFKASVGDFDRVLELKPARRPGHWQRGISCYYAGLYEEGRKQFEGYQDYDSNDVENAVWRYMCMARASGSAAARKDLLKIGADRRVPMRQVYDMFGGRLKPEGVLAIAAEQADKEALRRQLFYAHLYVGIHYDIEGDAARALQHLDKAVNDYRVDHYMADVARVHRDLVKKRLERSAAKHG